MTWFHGTSSKIGEAIDKSGIDFEATRRSDAGDFGWGLYLTKFPARARTYGDRVFEVSIKDQFAFIPNPYFLDGFDKVEPETEAEHLFHSLAFDGDKMLTVNGTQESREAAAKRIRDTFLAQGYLGIITLHSGGEAVVFSQEGITRLEGETSP